MEQNKSSKVKFFLKDWKTENKEFKRCGKTSPKQNETSKLDIP